MTSPAAPTGRQPDSASDALERLRPGLHLMAIRSLGTAEAAEEAVQETLARAVSALARGQPADPGKVPAFVAGIARHVIADACRARKRELPLDNVPEHAAQSETDALSVIISKAEQQAVRAALSGLSAADQELLRLAYFEGLAPEEIAGRAGEPSERIRKRKSRALERLRAAFLAAGGHEAGRVAT